MQNHLIELSVGETIVVGQYLVTVLDVHDDELCIEVSFRDGDEEMQLTLSEFAELIEA